jgi:hypothetical protein
VSELDHHPDVDGFPGGLMRGAEATATARRLGFGPEFAFNYTLPGQPVPVTPAMSTCSTGAAAPWT